MGNRQSMDGHPAMNAGISHVIVFVMLTTAVRGRIISFPQDSLCKLALNLNNYAYVNKLQSDYANIFKFVHLKRDVSVVFHYNRSQNM